MSKEDSAIELIKSSLTKLQIGAKAMEICDLLGDYFGRESNEENNIPGLKLAKSYGFHIGAMTLTEAKIYDCLIENLATLSIQYANLLRFHKDAKSIWEDMAFDFCPGKFRSARVDSKTLIYIKSRIDYNSRTYNLDEDNFPRKFYTYNSSVLEAFNKLRNKKIIAFCESMKDLELLPPKEMVRKLEFEDYYRIGEGVEICTAKYIKNNPYTSILQRKIAIGY